MKMSEKDGLAISAIAGGICRLTVPPDPSLTSVIPLNLIKVIAILLTNYNTNIFLSFSL
jgi:hypothetical protein